MIHSNCYPCGHFRLNQICLKQKKIHRDLCFEIRPEANLILEKTKKAAFPIKTAYKGRIPNYMSFRTETSSIYLNAINQYYCMEHTAFKIYTVYDHLPYYMIARLFNCGWEDLESICLNGHMPFCPEPIVNRQVI